MDYHTLLFVVSLLLPVISGSGSSIRCNVDSINLCYSKVRNSTFSNQAIPYALDPFLQQACLRFEEFSKCYVPIRSPCLHQLSLFLAATLEGVYASQGFQCGEGAEDYAKSKACFSRSDLQRDSKQCISTLNDQLAKAANETDTITRTNKLCDAGNIYTRCVDTYVEVLCDDQVALEWIRTYNRKSLSPLFSALACPGFELATRAPSKSDPTSTIILGVFLALFCAVVIVVMVFLVCFCVKHKYYRALPCFGCLLKRFRNQPPPYLPPNNSLPCAQSCKESCSSVFNLARNSQLDDSYFHEGNSEQQQQQHQQQQQQQNHQQQQQPQQQPKYIEEYVNKVFHENLNKGAQADMKHRLSEPSCKTATTGVNKDSETSCTSTPSTHFEPPICNPFTRSLSISNSNLDGLTEQDIVQDYY